ncbi:MAG: response regulator [Planctomycetaceae bacterium]
MSSRPLITVVEDEEAIAKGLQFNFELEGYDVKLFGDGPAVLRHISEHPGKTDCVVLDLMLPGMSGLRSRRAIRELEPQLPILVLSARTLSGRQGPRLRLRHRSVHDEAVRAPRTVEPSAKPPGS